TPPLGSPEGAVGLEITRSGPILRFTPDAGVAVTGVPITRTLDGAEQPMNTALFVPAGSSLALGSITGAGARSYLTVRGGIQVPDYLGRTGALAPGAVGGQ